MKRIAFAAVPLFLAAAPALATEIDCFPMCEEPAATVRAINACESRIVQEGVKIDARLKPVKQAYGIATDPTGYAIRTVSDAAGIKVPKVVGYALDPKGSLKAEVIRRVREEARKQVGMGNDCAAEIAAARAPAGE